VVGLAYAAWQTLRADDELWVVDESDEIDTPA
jgi:archaeosine-15-forming tRNA-guanine transglycosylase